MAGVALKVTCVCRLDTKCAFWGKKKKQGLTYLCAHLQFLALETQLLAGCYQSPCTELLF